MNPRHGWFRGSYCSGFSTVNDWTYSRPNRRATSTDTVTMTMRAAKVRGSARLLIETNTKTKPPNPLR